MPSSKGKPTDPELREELKEEIKQEPNKNGGGEGQWSAWKASKLAKEYEKQGGDYEMRLDPRMNQRRESPSTRAKGRRVGSLKSKTNVDGHDISSIRSRMAAGALF